jgi:hypothetical protein
MQLVVINVFILRYSLTGGHHNGGGGEYFPGAGNNMNCQCDEALKCCVSAVCFSEALQMCTKYKDQ